MNDSSTDAPANPPGRILLVDDEPANLRLLEQMLEIEGYTDVVGTPDPLEAVPLFVSFRPDLVLLDLHMPVLDGFGVMRLLKKVIPAGEFLPILVLTGDTGLDVRQRALSSGATDFVIKPFDGIEVLLRIRNLLHTRSLHGAMRDQNRRLEEMVAERTRALEIALRRAEAAGEAKAQFLSKMSHELRTPLGPIRGALELMAESELPVPIARLVEMARLNTDRMVALVNDILLLQAIEQGEAGVRKSSVDLRPLIAGAVAEVRERARAAGLSLEMEAPREMAAVETDPDRLTDVLHRLLDNALRFTEQGGVTVRVHADSPTGRPTRIEVSDTGIGIPPEKQERVFQPFEQADNSVTRRYEGTGIGLTIARALCGLLGYRLEVSSRPGEGSTFSVVM